MIITQISGLCVQVSQMGVTSILVDEGVNLSALSQGISKHAGSSTSS